MNEKVLETVLNEILEEQKDMWKELSHNTKVIECYSELFKQFEVHIKQFKVESPDLKPIENILNKRLSKIQELVEVQPKNVLHEKRILFYPEGDKQNFIKFLTNKILLYFSISVICYSLFFMCLNFWKENSKIDRYKYSLYWIYNKASKADRIQIEHVIKEFQNDSIYSARKQLFDK